MNIPTITTSISASCVALAITASASAAKLEETTTQTLPAETIEYIEVENVNGTITVEGWDRPEIEITYTKSAKGGNEENVQKHLDKMEVLITQEDEKISINTKIPNSGFSFWKLFKKNTSGSVKYVIHVPHPTNVDAETVNGGLRLKKLSGTIDAETVNGSIKAFDINGAANLETVNGGIYCKFTPHLQGGDMSFESVNGGIKVELPQDFAFSASGDTVNGGIHSDFPLNISKKIFDKKFNGTVNGGGSNLKFETVNGGITIASLQN
ncbi:MAG: hypothetical protein MI748_01325 [Opitutales bacterium]|nr:hypothetical protein [Opitutales bacterium]